MAATGRKIVHLPERATFTPLSPDLDIPALVLSTENFQLVQRVDARSINDSTFDDLKAFIQNQVIDQGLPLVIENWHLRSDWQNWLFDPEWLKQNHGGDCIHVRDIPNQTDIPMTLGHYLKNLNKLASKFTPANFDGSQQRLYGKDLDCPSAWRTQLSKILPQSTFYLSPSADLMSSLPPPARAENMMCYIGHEGTYTPAHKEMCASLGQNIMLYNSDGDDKPGSSIWFMTASADRDIVAEYWLSHMGHDIEVESHFASVQDLAAAPFTVFIVEQKVGDYILVPPLAPHQVWNRGQTTIKAAWNRTTVDTLELAISEALPKAKLVCRDEQYKNKAIIYDTLRKYAGILNADNGAFLPQTIPDISMEQINSSFVRLFNLFNTILLDECFSPDLSAKKVEKIPNEYNVTCAFCRCNIFNRFLSCKHCVFSVGGEEDMYDVCMECYARGRSCGCISDLQWVEQHDWGILVHDHENFRSLVLRIRGAVTADSPKPFMEAYQTLERKSLARVCQEQLIERPWVDTKDPDTDDEHDSKVARKKKKAAGLTLNCHVCKVRHLKWKNAACNTCPKSYCYGILWRAFDMDPFDDVLSKFVWRCPHCLGICSCGACRRNSKMRPYEPKGTILGASTKHVADPRSVESLVDFAKGNLIWLKDDSGSTITLKRKRESISTPPLQGQKDNSQDSEGIGENSRVMKPTPTGIYPGFEDNQDNDIPPPENSLVPIDPLLADHGFAGSSSAEHGQYFIDGNNDNADVSPSNIDAGPSSSAARSRRNSSNQLRAKQDMLQIEPAAALVEDHKEGETIEESDTDMDIGMEIAERNTGGRVGIINNIGRQPVLPGPSAMLTGALPTDRQNSQLRDAQSITEYVQDSPHILTNTGAEMNSYYNNHSPWLTNENGSSTNNHPHNHFHHHPRSSSSSSPNAASNHFHENRAIFDHEETAAESLSELEKNPMSFLEAAGLLNSSADDPGVPTTSSEPQPTPVASTMSDAVSAFTYVNYKDQHPSASIHPSMLMNNDYGHQDDNVIEPSALNIDTMDNHGNNYGSMRALPPPETIESKKRKRNSTNSSSDVVRSDVPFFNETSTRERILDNLLKQKQARSRKNVGAKEKSLKIVLKISPEKFRTWDAAHIKDVVTTDLTMASTGSPSQGSIPVKRKRGRPRKNPDAPPPPVVQKSKFPEKERNTRRESAWVKRKKEEEEAFQEYLKAREEQEKLKNVGGRIPKELVKKQRMVASREAKILMERKQMEEEERRQSTELPEAGTKDFHSGIIEGKAEQAIRHGKKLLRDQEKAEARKPYEITRIEAREQKTEETDRCELKHLEEPRRQEEDRRQEEEQECRRKEEIERAHREAKFITAGTAGIQIEDKGEECWTPHEGNDILQWNEENELEIWVPEGMNFAVVVKTCGVLEGSRDWRGEYEAVELMKDVVMTDVKPSGDAVAPASGKNRSRGEKKEENSKNTKSSEKRKARPVSVNDKTLPKRHYRRLAKASPLENAVLATSPQPLPTPTPSKATLPKTSQSTSLIPELKSTHSPAPCITSTLGKPTSDLLTKSSFSTNTSSIPTFPQSKFSFDAANDWPGSPSNSDSEPEPPASRSVVGKAGSSSRSNEENNQRYKYKGSTPGSHGAAAKWGVSEEVMEEFEWPKIDTVGIKEGPQEDWGKLAKYRTN